MQDPGSDEDRVERLRALSVQIAEAMAGMLAFQAQINAALHEIARTRDGGETGGGSGNESGAAGGRGRRPGTRRAA
jgi:hypothetical protein